MKIIIFLKSGGNIVQDMKSNLSKSAEMERISKVFTNRKIKFLNLEAENSAVAIPKDNIAAIEIR